MREAERTADGGVEDTLTVFLLGTECPFQCIFCDLDANTLTVATPPGALPAQLAGALECQLGRPERVKLYNASNLFEARAVPPTDDVALASELSGIAAVTVECHPRLVGERCWRFADDVDGRLEVAMGLETIHPEALPRLGKEMSLSDFERAASAIREHGLDLRVFVLVGLPFVEPAEHVEWAVRSARWALERGARHVSLIPLRPGAPRLAELREAGRLTPPSLATVERVAREIGSPPHRLASEAGGVVTIDLWDLDTLADCPSCLPGRKHRLEGFNRTGRFEGSAPPCLDCGSAGGSAGP